MQGLPLKVLPIVNAGQLLVHSLEWKVILITLGSYCRLCNQTNGFLIAVPVPEAWCKADCQLQIRKEHAKRNSGFSYLIHLVLWRVLCCCLWKCYACLLFASMGQENGREMSQAYFQSSLYCSLVGTSGHLVFSLFCGRACNTFLHFLGRTVSFHFHPLYVCLSHLIVHESVCCSSPLVFHC